jgi:DNA-binding NarL/FixJ family response regulator
MRQIFLSVDARERSNWREAFAGLTATRFDALPVGAALVWVLLPAGQGVEALVASLRKGLAGRSLIVLADEPAEDEAIAALAAGAAGYCNGHAAPQVLLQVATAVESGGIWVGQGLLQRLLAATSRLLPARPDAETPWRSLLTAREQEAAVLLAAGASNKEIARRLEITERTVKFHVSAMLDKLGVRDRLQLSLIINGVDKRQ